MCDRYLDGRYFEALILVFSTIILFIGVASVNPVHGMILLLTAEQPTPEKGPYLPDGTISFALYGEFTEAEDVFPSWFFKKETFST